MNISEEVLVEDMSILHAAEQEQTRQHLCLNNECDPLSKGEIMQL